MPLFPYSYNITGSFPNQIFAKDTLYNEVLDSSIVPALFVIDADLIDVTFNFKGALSVGEQVVLDNIVAYHSGFSLSQSITVDQGVSGTFPWSILLSTSSVNTVAISTSSIVQVTGSVFQINQPTTQSVFIAGSGLTLPTSVSNFPTTQSVSGIVTASVTFPTTQSVFVANNLTLATGSQPVYVTNATVTQSVKIDQSTTLPVSISNFPSIQTVTGTITVPNLVNITGSVSVLNNATVAQGPSGSIPWKVTEYESATFSILSLDTTIGNGKSMLSILNAAGSGVVIKIHSIKIINTQNSAVTGIVSDFRLLRMTNHSAGTLLTAQTLDTQDSLNGNVTCRTGATITGASSVPLFRYKWSSDEWAPGTLDTESLEHSFQNTNPVYMQYPGRKPITLRPGEGITITHNTNSTAGSFDIDINFTQE